MIKNTISNILWTYRQMYNLAPWEITGNLILQGVFSLLPIAGSYVFAMLLDEITIIIDTKSITSITDIAWGSNLSYIILATAVIGALWGVLGGLNAYINARLSNYYQKVFMEKYNLKVGSLDVQQFEDPALANLIKKANDNLWDVYRSTTAAIELLTFIITAISTGIIAFAISPYILLIITVLAIPEAVIFANRVTEFRKYYDDTQSRRRLFWDYLYDIRADENIEEHKITGGNGFLANKVQDLRISIFGKEMKISQKYFSLSFISTTAKVINSIAIPLYLIHQVITGNFTIGNFSFYRSETSRFSTNFSKITSKAIDIIDRDKNVQYVKDIFELESVVLSGTKSVNTQKAPVIEFVNVSFKYPNAKIYALKDVSLTINPMDEIAIVGENGAGKTTFIKLLLRFYDPTEGEILIDGVNLKELRIDEYYKLMSVSLQEFNKYDQMSLKENISIGQPDEPLNQAKVEEAAKSANAAEFIERLPNKYNQNLSKRYEEGTKLSTGQWQKLALARMFYRNTPFLVLDEPTAAIDAEAEYEIFKHLYEFTEDKTIVVISHRFSTVRNADMIYVFKQGGILESGNHAELLEIDGTYARAFKKQAEGYKKSV